MIQFYRTTDPYGEFSNFYKRPVEIDGKMWPTTEHYFQAMKFEDPEVQEKIRNLKTAREAAAAGRSTEYGPIRPHWDIERIAVMLTALRAKFTQHRDLRTLLLNTGFEVIIEHSENDRFWADGGDGTGSNMLGILLMYVRLEMWMPGSRA